MAKKIYKTALGKVIDMDALKAMNETTVAVGNMRVNARGDELGPGGTIKRTRAEIMKEYYSSGGVVEQNPKVPDSPPAASPVNHGARTINREEFVNDEPEADIFETTPPPVTPTPVRAAPSPSPSTGSTPRPKLRGSLADSITQRGTAEVWQEPTVPEKKINRF